MSLAPQAHLFDTERGGAAAQVAQVVALADVVTDDVAVRALPGRAGGGLVPGDSGPGPGLHGARRGLLLPVGRSPRRLRVSGSEGAREGTGASAAHGASRLPHCKQWPKRGARRKAEQGREGCWPLLSPRSTLAALRDRCPGSDRVPT